MKKGVSRFSIANFWSNNAEKIRGHPFNASEKLGYPNIFMHNRGYHVLPLKIFGLTVPKNFVGIPSMLQKIWGIEKPLCKIESITFFRRKFLSHTAEKLRKGTLSLISGMKKF